MAGCHKEKLTGLKTPLLPGPAGCRMLRFLKRADFEFYIWLSKNSATCTSTVPPHSCLGVPLLLSSTPTFAPMPRPAALSTSPATIPPFSGFATHQLYFSRDTRKGHDRPTFLRPLFSYSYELLFPQVLYFHNHLNCPGVSPLPPAHPHESRVTSRKSRRFTLLRTLLLSCASFFDSRRLFSMLCALFLQNRGVGVCMR